MYITMLYVCKSRKKSDFISQVKLRVSLVIVAHYFSLSLGFDVILCGSTQGKAVQIMFFG